MKKVMFGISLILFGISLILMGEFGNVLVFDDGIGTFVCAISPLVGLVMSVWGLFEKDK